MNFLFGSKTLGLSLFSHLAFLVWIVPPKRERALEREKEREREREMDCNSEEGSSSSLLPGGVDRSLAASLSPEDSSSSSLSSLATVTRTDILISRVVSSPIIPLEAAAQAPSPPPPPLPVVSLPPKTSDNFLAFSKQSSLPASWPKMGNDAGVLEVARTNVSDDEAAPLPQQKQRSEAQVTSPGPPKKQTEKKRTVKGSD